MENDNDHRGYVTPTRFPTAMGIILAIQLLGAAAVAVGERGCACGSRR